MEFFYLPIGAIPQWEFKQKDKLSFELRLKNLGDHPLCFNTLEFYNKNYPEKKYSSLKKLIKDETDIELKQTQYPELPPSVKVDGEQSLISSDIQVDNHKELQKIINTLENIKIKSCYKHLTLGNPTGEKCSNLNFSLNTFIHP